MTDLFLRRSLSFAMVLLISLDWSATRAATGASDFVDTTSLYTILGVSPDTDAIRKGLMQEPTISARLLQEQPMSVGGSAK